jgi:hypothetical protein
MLDRLNYYIINSVTKEIFCPDTLKFYEKMEIIPETKINLRTLMEDENLFDLILIKNCKIIKIKR